jgi:peptidylglycine monooxygenase
VDEIPDDGDSSGVVIKYTNIPQPKAAGVYWTATGGRFGAHATTKAETACKIRTELPIHPFAFRVHTHSLGRAVSGWKVTPNMEWTLLGKEDPQLPQMFWPINDDTIILNDGDTLATRCTMVNDGDSAVSVGSTRKDEMCNYYLMFWVDGTTLPEQKTCSSLGPPFYSWGGWLFGGGLTKIPDIEASTID